MKHSIIIVFYINLRPVSHVLTMCKSGGRFQGSCRLQIQYQKFFKHHTTKGEQRNEETASEILRKEEEQLLAEFPQRPGSQMR